MKLLTLLFPLMLIQNTEPITRLVNKPNQFEWYFEGVGMIKIIHAYVDESASITTEYAYKAGTGRNTFHKNSNGMYTGVWKTKGDTGVNYEGELSPQFNADGTATGNWTWKGTDGTIMSMPITNRDEYAHDSFITIKKQLYSDEKWGIKLLKKNKKMNSSTITFISFLYFNEGGSQKLEDFQAKAKPYFEKYKIEILHQYQPVSKGQIGDSQNDIEQPDLIQIFTSERMADFQLYMADEEVKNLAEIRNSGLRKMNVSFGTEIETADIITASARNAFHGIALVTCKDDASHQLIEFNRQGQAGGLFSKYGIHAESFIKVMKSMSAIGELDYQQPELIVIFGVDDPSKMKEYIGDSDYQKLAPIRDNALKSYHFFMCR